MNESGGEQLNIFDYAESRSARDMAMERVELNAEPEWKDLALEALYQTAREEYRFIVDEVWTRIPQDKSTHENRAIGPVMTRGKSLEWIEPTDQFRPSQRITSHGVPRRIWKSLIFGQRPLV